MVSRAKLGGRRGGRCPGVAASPAGTDGARAFLGPPQTPGGMLTDTVRFENYRVQGTETSPRPLGGGRRSQAPPARRVRATHRRRESAGAGGGEWGGGRGGGEEVPRGCPGGEGGTAPAGTLPGGKGRDAAGCSAGRGGAPTAGSARPADRSPQGRGRRVRGAARARGGRRGGAARRDPGGREAAARAGRGAGRRALGGRGLAGGGCPGAAPPRRGAAGGGGGSASRPGPEEQPPPPLANMADLEAVLADVSYLMAMEKSKATPAARASKKIALPEPRYGRPGPRRFPLGRRPPSPAAASDPPRPGGLAPCAAASGRRPQVPGAAGGPRRAWLWKGASEGCWGTPGESASKCPARRAGAPQPAASGCGCHCAGPDPSLSLPPVPPLSRPTSSPWSPLPLCCVSVPPHPLVPSARCPWLPGAPSGPCFPLSPFPTPSSAQPPLGLLSWRAAFCPRLSCSFQGLVPWRSTSLVCFLPSLVTPGSKEWIVTYSVFFLGLSVSPAPLSSTCQCTGDTLLRG